MQKVIKNFLKATSSDIPELS